MPSLPLPFQPRDKPHLQARAEHNLAQTFLRQLCAGVVIVVMLFTATACAHYITGPAYCVPQSLGK